MENSFRGMEIYTKLTLRLTGIATNVVEDTWNNLRVQFYNQI